MIVCGSQEAFDAIDCMEKQIKLKEEIEKILPKETAHYYTEKLIALIEDVSHQSRIATLEEVEKEIGEDENRGYKSVEINIRNELRSELKSKLLQLKERAK